MRARPFTFVLLVALAGCTSASEPGTARVMGAIAGFNQDDPRIDVVASAGSVLVRVSSYGNACYSLADTQVERTGRDALVTPYDFVEVGGACADLLVELVHETTIPLESGPATITVRGTDRRGASAARPAGDTILVRRTVVVP